MCAASLVIQLNNSACGLIEQGQYEAAIKMLVTALALAKGQQDQQLYTKATKMLHDNDLNHYKSSFPSGGKNLNPDPTTRSSTDFSCSFTIYKTPFRIEVNDDNDKGLSYCEAGIVVFNLAMSYHCAAMDKQSSCCIESAKELMQVSIKLYELARRIEFQKTEHIRCIIRTMASTNNLLHLYHKLGDEEMLIHHSQGLLQVLLFVRYRKADNTKDNFLEESKITNDVFDCFLKNVCFMVYGNMVAAASA